MIRFCWMEAGDEQMILEILPLRFGRLYFLHCGQDDSVLRARSLGNSLLVVLID